jgi:hypothetical protein
MINPLRLRNNIHSTEKSSAEKLKSKNEDKKIKKDLKKELLQNSNNYFSDDYFKAREKFRAAAKNKNMDCWSEKIQDDLTIDFAYRNPESEKLLIIVSGVHGVEGYAGSALQLIFLDKIYSQFKDSFAILLIHSYNPYGFKNNRRVNENNVDLNRNCLNNYSENRGIDKNLKDFFMKNEKIFFPNCPRQNKLIEESKYSFILAKTLLKHGVEGAIKAGAIGQNFYPKGVGFIGLGEEKSTKIFKETVNKFTSNFKKTILLDIHTGLGRKNNISAYAENPKNTEEFFALKKAFKNLKSRKLSKMGSLSHSGSITQYFYGNSKSKINVGIIMEIGTASNVSPTLSLATLSRANLEENQITHFGPKNKLEKARLKLKNVYLPNAKRHRKVILVKSEKFLKDFCKQTELL